MEVLLIMIITLFAALYIYDRIRKLKKNKFIKSSNYPKETELPYKSKPLLTNAEYKFYYYLKTACDKVKLMVCPKVRMEDIITVTSNDRGTINRFRGYIRARHFDFIICDNEMKTICAIELDDSSHNTEKAKNIDEFKDNVCKKIGIKLYRVKVGTNYMDKITEIIKDFYKTDAHNS